MQERTRLVLKYFLLLDSITEKVNTMCIAKFLLQDFRKTSRGTYNLQIGVGIQHENVGQLHEVNIIERITKTYQNNKEKILPSRARADNPSISPTPSDQAQMSQAQLLPCFIF